MCTPTGTVRLRSKPCPNPRLHSASSFSDRSGSLCACSSCEPGRLYLRRRGITTWPEALYFHPECPFGGETAPAILAPVNDAEAAIIATLAPASYTAIVRGAGDTSGVGLVEFYRLNP